MLLSLRAMCTVLTYTMFLNSVPAWRLPGVVEPAAAVERLERWQEVG